MPGNHLKYKFLDIKALTDRNDEISRRVHQYYLVNINKGKKVRMRCSDAGTMLKAAQILIQLLF